MSSQAISRSMKGYLLVSFLLMLLHKVESYRTSEWKTSPVYRYILGLGFEDGKLVFLTFVVTLFVGLVLCFLIISWRSGKWLFLVAWGLSFVLELHHLVKAVWIYKSYYSGLYTSILYVAFGFFYWKELFNNYRGARRNERLAIK